jgi:hypothetical protein
MRRSDETITVTVPFRVRQYGGRKQILMPDGTPVSEQASPLLDSPLVRSLARAFRWRRLLETGEYLTIDEIAKAERINASYVSRVLRLTLLAPGIVQAILDGKQPDSLTLSGVMTGVPELWHEQT